MCGIAISDYATISYLAMPTRLMYLLFQCAYSTVLFFSIFFFTEKLVLVSSVILLVEYIVKFLLSQCSLMEHLELILTPFFKLSAVCTC